MLCRHCDRPLTLFQLKCRTCRTRQVSWYVAATLLCAAVFLLTAYAILRHP